MNFIHSIKTCFRKYFVFKGRATRSEFWWFQLFATVLTFAGMSVDTLVLGFSLETAATPFVLIFTIAIILPSAARYRASIARRWFARLDSVAMLRGLLSLFGRLAFRL